MAVGQGQGPRRAVLRGEQQGLAPGLRGMDLLGSRPKGKGTLAAAPCGGSYAWHTFLIFFGRSWGRRKLFVHSSCCSAPHGPFEPSRAPLWPSWLLHPLRPWPCFLVCALEKAVVLHVEDHLQNNRQQKMIKRDWKYNILKRVYMAQVGYCQKHAFLASFVGGGLRASSFVFTT